MGVRGLTSYIGSRSHIYMESYELSNSYLVIDGNSAASQLYKLHCSCNDCFGGDYDKYSNVIKNFFNALTACDIVPIVIFDGGYEKRKLRTVMERLKTKTKNALGLNSVTEGCYSQFPLFLREVFKDVVRSLNIKCVRCEFEADGIIASTAKSLDCPVLSFDSDFFIFDALYIPFPTLSLNPDRRFNKQAKKYDYFLKCSIYKIDKFLQFFGGMDKANLPLLAVLLGNDYMKRREFVAFYRQLKIQKTKRIQNEHQRRIRSVIMWLKNETFTSACQKILSRFKAIHRKNLMYRIEQATKAYMPVDSDISQFLGVKPMVDEQQVSSLINDINIAANDDDAIDDEEIADIEVDNLETEDEELLEDVHQVDTGGGLSDVIPEFFTYKFKTCQYPPCFMDILTLNCYYCIPQVEEVSRSNSHVVSLNILAAIHKIIRGTFSKPLVYYARSEHSNVKRYYLETSKLNLPNISEVQELHQDQKMKIFLEILDINDNFVKNYVECFPPDWRLLLICLTYWVKHGKVDQSYIYSIVLCTTILFYVDKEIGFFRSSKSFFSKCGTQMEQAQHSSTEKQSPKASENISDNFAHVNYKDCLFCMKQVIHNFQMDPKMRSNARLYDKFIVHDLCEFQSCALHIKYLNCLLDFPFLDIHMATIFDGTFIYNMSINLQKRKDIAVYIKSLLVDCPSILNLFESIVHNIFESHKHLGCETAVSIKNIRKRRRTRKKKVQCTTVEEESPEQNSSGENSDNVFDENNKFTLLTSLNK